MTSLLLLVATAAFAAPPAPVAHWTMDAIKDGIVADVSGHGHDARAFGKNGVLPRVVPGIIGKALRFDPAEEQYLQVPAAELADLPAFTVMAWIKPSHHSGHQQIIGNKPDQGGGPALGWRLSYFFARIFFGYGSAGGDVRTSTANWSVPQSFWSHVAAVFDGKRVKLYVNANLLADQPATAAMLPSHAPLVIGNYVGRKSAYPFGGLMDDVRLYDKALNADEIFAAAADDLP